MTDSLISPHLSEQALQQAAELPALLPATQAAHLQSCTLCQERVATYQHLFMAVAQLPQPAFSFDLTASVLAQLPPTQIKPAFPWALVLVGALVVGVVGLFLVFFGESVLAVFQSAATGQALLIAVLIGLLSAVQGLELLNRHRGQMGQLLHF